MNKELLFEIKRKIVHILFCLFFFIMIYFDLVTGWDLLLILLLGIMLSVASRSFEIPIISKFLDAFEREKYRKTFPGKGLIFMVFGILATFQLFKKDLTLAAILMMMTIDPITSILGKYFKLNHFPLKETKNHKILLANLFAWAVGSLVACFVLNPIEAIIGALGGTVTEYFEFEVNKDDVDDNLTVPLATATSIIIFRKFFFA